MILWCPCSDLSVWYEIEVALKAFISVLVAAVGMFGEYPLQIIFEVCCILLCFVFSGTVLFAPTFVEQELGPACKFLHGCPRG